MSEHQELWDMLDKYFTKKRNEKNKGLTHARTNPVIDKDLREFKLDVTHALNVIESRLAALEEKK